jgi:hypothetical protein
MGRNESCLRGRGTGIPVRVNTSVQRRIRGHDLKKYIGRLEI